ncbi:MAG: hypothetical protein Phog2KO_44210 [Phototrophicaceae bacterium]
MNCVWQQRDEWKETAEKLQIELTEAVEAGSEAIDMHADLSADYGVLSKK